jgi:hypothetical protein
MRPRIAVIDCSTFPMAPPHQRNYVRSVILALSVSATALDRLRAIPWPGRTAGRCWRAWTAGRAGADWSSGESRGTGTERRAW